MQEHLNIFPDNRRLSNFSKEALDLVVMGTRGRSNLGNSIMGAVAEKVFKRSPVNVFKSGSFFCQLGHQLNMGYNSILKTVFN